MPLVNFGAGTMEVKAPRVNDKRMVDGERVPIAHHKPPAVLAALVGIPACVILHLGFQGR